MCRSLLILIVLCFVHKTIAGTAEEEHGVKYADKCEACKILAIELQSRLLETGKSHDVIEIGYSLDDVKPKKRTKYEKSELRLIESLDGVCENILQYNLHKEREDSTRFSKGMSQTFQTLHGLVDKGVKVDLGIPLELWDKPSVEITTMKTQCETMLEENESDIEDWYWKHQDVSLMEYLCRQRVLLEGNSECLDQKLKGDTGKPAEKTEL